MATSGSLQDFCGGLFIPLGRTTFLMASANPSSSRKPIDPATRRRLQQCFEHGGKSAATNNLDYATDMFTQCVVGDPGNNIYLQQFLTTLYRKYNNNKKGNKLAAASSLMTKGAIKKASGSKDWLAVIKAGVEMLKLNPWDVSTLLAMAAACEGLHCDDTQLTYLKGALDADAKNLDVLRAAARGCARVGRFDEAISLWNKVQSLKPGDIESQKMVGELAIERTIHQGRYEDASSSTDVMADKQAQAERHGTQAQTTPEQRLEKAIAKDPAELSNYVDLADLYLRTDRFADAVTMFSKALEVSGGDVNVRERLEDAQMRKARADVETAERLMESQKTPEAQERAQKMRIELNRIEIDVYRSRTERYPTNLGYKYELGVRLYRAGQFNEAIRVLQDARADAKRKGQVHLRLGDAFYQLKKPKLAMSNYELAIQSLTGERDLEDLKLALYRAGRLSLHTQDKASAEKYLTQLAGLDFGYKDVAALLDKIQ